MEIASIGNLCRITYCLDISQMGSIYLSLELIIRKCFDFSFGMVGFVFEWIESTNTFRTLYQFKSINPCLRYTK